jgi:hypothetical protein
MSTLKFYIVKRDEREGDGYGRIVEFSTPNDLEHYLTYHRGYIESMVTLGESE